MRHHALAAALIALPALSFAAAPATPQIPVTDVYHGVTVVDPYRWMEDMKSPEFQTWLKAQADYANDVLTKIPGRDALRKRLGELADLGEITGGYEQAGGKVFYLKRAPGENARKLWVRKGSDGAERLLLDPDSMPGEGGHHAIDWYSASPDGKLLAVGISMGGSENSVLRIIDVATGKLLGDAIDRAGLNEPGIAWLPDGKSFYYNRHPADERYNKSAVFLHHLGNDPAKDVAVFGWGATPSREFGLADLPYLSTSKGSKWVLAEVLHGDSVNRSYWIAPLETVKTGDTPWRRIIGPDDKVTHAVLSGSSVYAVTQKRASRRELLKFDLASGKITVAMAASDAVLQAPIAAKNAVFVKALDGGVSRLFKVDKSGKVSSVALPFEGTVREISPGDDGSVLVRLEGWTRPAQVLKITGKRAETTRLQKPLKVDTSGVEAQRVMVKSNDGTMVPLSILSQKNVAHDGKRPTILSGYGAYGISMEPRFAATRLAWLERGGVQAVCHVRGGGELGEDWHQGGYIQTKQNTVSDFIACAEWLIANHYTSPATLAGVGGSAGGITIGGTITQRPDLLAAAQSAVGISDMLRMETTPNGPPNIEEFGTVKNPDHFKSMYAISPYHRVKDGVAYPAVIVTTGANDPRVDAWLPGKFAARLQTANPNGKPVILRVDYDAGHGIGSNVGQALDETADVWAFFLWQMGDPAFQPTR